MSSENILTTPILDILFENRNKEYGAYPLRKYYANRLYLSLGLMTFFVAVICTMTLWKSNAGSDEIAPTIIDIPPMADLKPLPPTEPPKPVQATKVAVIQNVVPIITKDAEQTEVPEQDQMKDKLIGSFNRDGDTIAEDAPAPPAAEPAKEVAPPAPAPEEKEEVLATADVMPEYPGGVEALKRFLSRNLRNPDEEMTSAGTIRVVARFVVDKDGNISQVIFKETGGIKFEQEVSRVLKKMPKWKPGIFKGRPTAVYFTLPVVFQVTDQ